MKRLVIGGVALSLLAAANLGAGADDEKAPTIKEVMRKLHKGADSPLARLKGQLKADSPDWKAVQDETKDFVILGAALAKNDPPRGEKEGWKTLADAYFQDAKALDNAAREKDRDDAREAFKKVSGSCKGCHTAHKPN